MTKKTPLLITAHTTLLTRMRPLAVCNIRARSGVFEEYIKKETIAMSILHKLLLLCTAWLFAFHATALAQPTEAPASHAAVEKSLLWEITGPSMTKPSYLFGTIHIIGKKDFFLTDATTESLAATERLAFEIDMADMTDFTKLMPMMRKMYMQNDTTLSDLYTPEEYKLVEAHFQKSGLPLFLLKNIKPMFLSMLGAEDLMGGGGGGEKGEVVSYEMELMKLAKERKMPTAGLETMEFQIGLFDRIPYQVQAKMLLETIQGGSGQGQDDTLEKMVQLYKDQDVAGMQQMMGAEEGGIAGFEDLLLNGRNENWVPIMANMMALQPTFFAVGAGHLGGEQGVVALLRKAGYTVSAKF